ncbi:hypothetical protein BOTBODRAFT_58768 [Botryobasidium botryosum FD-172 SS1]|uniref:Uncharacterized protein n=1 Tax=Botryobasidium botryosum (strain FD-172 SS1) TaxID=930990 RepID=A0A067MCG1_BOTB1|nr:hypothetical protein BOTBODRAFT_58768 [Botryobasidium botryosum FD-172 SS1]
MQVFHHKIGASTFHFIIRLQSPAKTPHEQTLTLTCEAGGVERLVCGPVQLQFAFNPDQARFHLYLVPNASIFASFKLRAWLITGPIQHRIFAMNELFIAHESTFPRELRPARKTDISNDTHIYSELMGGASVAFIVKIDEKPAGGDDEYSISLSYEAGGITGLLCRSLPLRITCPLADVRFMIYVIQCESQPKGARHKIRLWIKSHEGACQKLWQKDNWWIGGNLDFSAVTDAIVVQPGILTSTVPKLEPPSEEPPSYPLHV